MFETIRAYHPRIIPLVFLAIYEPILIHRGADFDGHFITITMVGVAFLSWPDGTEASESAVGFHPLPPPFDLFMAIGFLLVPGVLMLAHVLI